MQFYQPNFGGRPIPTYPQNFVSPTAYRRPNNTLYYPSEFVRPMDSYYFPNHLYPANRQPYYSPYQQTGPSKLPNALNLIMDHAGTITSGVNMVRQIGSIMSLFR